MTPEQLLQECELLTYSGRMRRMVELGQLAASDNSISETLTELAQGDVYQRTLAAQACYGSRNSAQALKGLSDPSRSVRSLTINLIALICSDDELQVALDTVPLDMKIILLRRLRQRQAQPAVGRKPRSRRGIHFPGNGRRGTAGRQRADLSAGARRSQILAGPAAAAGSGVSGP